jgi:alpha-tubulin suppressor-like RCC1 family protein
MSWGEARCWGVNGAGELGDGTTTDRTTPVAVAQSAGGAPLPGVQALAGGFEHNCALMSWGEIRCWGLNNRGQIGDGSTTDQLTPRPVFLAPGPGTSN